jgi:hypothetical protein
LNALLYAVPLAQPVKEGVRVSWRALAASVTRLRVLFDGHEMETRHLLKKADAKTMREFNAQLEQAQEYGGRIKLLFQLAATYNQLKLTAYGYKDDLIPAHHRAFAVFGHLSSQLLVTRKN